MIFFMPGWLDNSFDGLGACLKVLFAHLPLVSLDEQRAEVLVRGNIILKPFPRLPSRELRGEAFPHRHPVDAAPVAQVIVDGPEDRFIDRPGSHFLGRDDMGIGTFCEYVVEIMIAAAGTKYDDLRGCGQLAQGIFHVITMPAMDDDGGVEAPLVEVIDQVLLRFGVRVITL